MEKLKEKDFFFVEVFVPIDDTFIVIDKNYKVKSYFITPTNHVNLPPSKIIANCFDEVEEEKLRKAINDYDTKHGEGMFCKEIINGRDIESYITSLKKA